MLSNNIHNQKGITFLEALVATAVIGIGFSGLLALSASNIRAADSSQHKFIASNLAIEGVEVVRRIRDSNWLQNQAWDTGLTNGDWSVQYDSESLGSSHTLPLRVDSATGLYQYNSGDTTPYTRIINIFKSGSEPFFDLTVTIEWSERGSTQSLQVVDRLYDWK